MRFGRGNKHLLILIATVAALSSAAWQWLPAISQWNERQLASQIVQGIEKGGGDGASEHLQKLAGMGPPALSPLVVLASSHRAGVAQQARQIVDEKFSAWQTQAEVDRDFDLAQSTTTLASALVNHADRFDAIGKRWASSLAIRMVDLAELLDADDAAALLQECDRVLAAIPPQGPRLRSFPETAQQQLPATENRLIIPEVRLDLLATPSESAREILSQGQKENPSPSPSPADRRGGFGIGTKISQWSPKWSAESYSRESSLAPTDRVAPLLIPTFQQPNDHQPGELASEVVDVPTPQEMLQRQKALRKVSSKILITQLPEADHYETGSIRSVLRQRGLTETEWALAKLFSSPHIEDRNQLVEAVSALPAGNTRRWLRWLLKDDAAEVRLKALTALATTNDPQLFQLAREMAVADQDARVSELATRIMNQVR